MMLDCREPRPWSEAEALRGAGGRLTVVMKPGVPAMGPLVLALAGVQHEDEGMYILLRHLDGRLEEGIVLSVGSNFMRIAIAGAQDTVMFMLRDAHWVSDDNDVVEIECMAPTGRGGWCHSIDLQMVLEEMDAWASKPLPVGCVPAPAAAGRLWN